MSKFKMQKQGRVPLFIVHTVKQDMTRHRST